VAGNYGKLVKKALHKSTATSSGIADTVYHQLLEDFPPSSVAWTRAATWDGPKDIPLDEIDFSNRDNWRATHDTAHVNDFRKLIRKGEKLKPAILVNEPNNEKMIIADGHHRAVASEREGVPLHAYVTHVGTVKGPWDKMHGSQRGKPSL
jgi:hypothetical protein